MKCPACGFHNEESNGVCSACGTILDQKTAKEEKPIAKDEKKNKTTEKNVEKAKTNRNTKRIVIVLFAICLVICLIVFGLLKLKEYNEYKDLQEKRNHYAMILNDANCAVDSKQFTDAEQLYKSAIELDPSISAGYFGLSKVYKLEGDTVSEQMIKEQGFLATGDSLLMN